MQNRILGVKTPIRLEVLEETTTVLSYDYSVTYTRLIYTWQCNQSAANAISDRGVVQSGVLGPCTVKSWLCGCSRISMEALTILGRSLAIQVFGCIRSYLATCTCTGMQCFPQDKHKEREGGGGRGGGLVGE